MIAVFLRRGPWGWMHAQRPEIAQAHLRLDGLAALPEALSKPLPPAAGEVGA
jgi:hypothetical protein